MNRNRIDPRSHCPYPAGHPRKILWLAARAKLQLPLFNPADCPERLTPRTRRSFEEVEDIRRRVRLALQEGQRPSAIARRLGIRRNHLAMLVKRRDRRRRPA